MKKIVFSLLSLCFFSVAAIAQVRMPAPSPTQTIKQEFAIGSIELTYSRPAAKGRKIFGDLVPYNKLWRTGANAATKIVLIEPLEIGGKNIDTGSYVLYTIPGIDSWDIILNKGLKNWGTDGYKESEDVARIRVEPMKMKTRVESFTMQFTDVKPESCELHIMWDKTAVAIPIKADFKDKVRAQLEKALQGDKKPYWQAAQFYNEYDKNLPKALENVGKALEANDKAFWIWIYKAKIQKEMGDNAGAMESSKKSLELATEAKNDDYIKINKDFQKGIK
jgi:tetratricopeptide (TPR) repeat protein